MNLENLHVGRSGDRYCLAWKLNGDQYHIWLNREDYAVDSHYRPLFKAAAAAKDVKRLSLLTPRNKTMFEDALAEATVQHLFEKCEQEWAAAEAKDNADRAERQKLELARKTAPEMLALLEAIAEFWVEYEKFQTPLHPGAMITDKDECIAELVRDVVRKAKGGAQ